MRLRLKAIWLSLVVMALGVAGSAALVPHPAFALFEGSKGAACSGIDLSTNDTCDPTKAAGATTGVNHALALVLNILSLIVGVAAVITIVVGGLRYITSQGDPNSVAGAQRAVIYALVGLVIVSIAQVIVRFVLTKVK